MVLKGRIIPITNSGSVSPSTGTVTASHTTSNEQYSVESILREDVERFPWVWIVFPVLEFQVCLCIWNYLIKRWNGYRGHWREKWESRKISTEGDDKKSGDNYVSQKLIWNVAVLVHWAILNLGLIRCHLQWSTSVRKRKTYSGMDNLQGLEDNFGEKHVGRLIAMEIFKCRG